ncbi:MAG TPA: sigma-54 dependent transcriptional regulator [Anaeromyxobacteraceae bacterium]
MARPRILVVDAHGAAELRAGLAQHGFDTAEAATPSEALLALASVGPEAVLAGIDDATDGVLLARGLAELGSDAALVVMADLTRLDAAVATLRAGAESYLVRPADPAQAAVLLGKALEKRRLRLDAALLRAQLRGRHALVGSAPELQVVQEVLRRAAPTRATVLVLGESGTGRELVAQALHDASPRRDRPFVRVSCAARSQALLESELFGHEPGVYAEAALRREGCLEAAHGGTVFLHEVSHLPLQLQVKLLRVLQQGELERMGGRETIRCDVRVVASSTRDLAEAVREGRFRDDLYYRLNVVTVRLPALRERKGDIPALAQHFLARSPLARATGVQAVSPGALSALFAYEWPGNVRELEAVVERAIELCTGREIGLEHLPAALHGGGAGEASALVPGATLFEIEREAILRTLDRMGGSTVRAAETLGVSVRKIQYRLKEYRLGQHGPRRRGAEAPPWSGEG